MLPAETPHIAYVLKMYPRLSETFIVNEILAHEAAGYDIEIFSLRPPVDGRFHSAIGRVRAMVTYLPSSHLKADDLWRTTKTAGGNFPNLWNVLTQCEISDAMTVHQSIALAELIQTRGLTHVHAHFGTAATSVARIASLITGVPYSFTAHAKDIFHESVKDEDLRSKLRDAHATITVSDFNHTWLQQKYGEDANQVHRIYNGLDLSEFEFNRSIARDNLVLGIGRLVEKKGFQHLIEACAILKNRAVDFRCEIIGDGPLRDKLANCIRELEVEDRVELLGALSRHEVLDSLRKAQVMAAPCVVASDGNRDGLPTVLLESMAIGAPCISTDVTGIPEIVRHDETGLIVQQHDPIGLADAIECLLLRKDIAKRLSVAGRELVEKQFDIHNNTAAMRKFFDHEPIASQSSSLEAM